MPPALRDETAGDPCDGGDFQTSIDRFLCEREDSRSAIEVAMDARAEDGSVVMRTGGVVGNAPQPLPESTPSEVWRDPRNHRAEGHAALACLAHPDARGQVVDGETWPPAYMLEMDPLSSDWHSIDRMPRIRSAQNAMPSLADALYRRKNRIYALLALLGLLATVLLRLLFAACAPGGNSSPTDEQTRACGRVTFAETWLVQVPTVILLLFAGSMEYAMRSQGRPAAQGYGAVVTAEIVDE